MRQFHQAENELVEYWKQRSKIQWNTEGDRNTAFYQAVATNRRKYNIITHITTEEGQIISDPSQIRRIFVNYFKGIYSPTMNSQDTDHTDHTAYFAQFPPESYKTIPTQAHSSLVASPTEIEIKEALFSMGPDKSPRLDGISARFLQSNWIMIKDALI